jgi:hypothetical protein
MEKRKSQINENTGLIIYKKITSGEIFLQRNFLSLLRMLY